ncbi:MAG: beta-lactamase family protein [Butyrivibrio sp.]|nr:beta-lactamase family protein [Butyrivibrio sp.]
MGKTVITEQKKSLLQACMDRAVAEKECAGVGLMVLSEGEEVCFLAAGQADLDKQTPMERDTIGHLYSMSKPITAAAAWLLIQDGLLELYEPVGNYIESFRNQMVCVSAAPGTVPAGQPMGREQRVACGGYLVPAQSPVLIRDLLNMTSGLTYGGDSLSERETSRVIQEAIDRLDTAQPMTTMELAERIGACPLEFHPGSQMRYGLSADILGAVIERVTGMRFGAFLAERLFDPLEMKDTAFHVPEEKRDRLAGEYVCENGTITRYHGNNLAIRDDAAPNAFESGGAGLFSTLSDYAHFASMMMALGTWKGKEILRPETVRFMTQGELSPAQQITFNWTGQEGYSYANLMRTLRWPEQAGVIGHKGEYGWDGWLGPYFCNDPESRTTFLMMLQRKDYGTGTLTRRLRNIVFS